MRLHPAFGAIITLILGISVVSFAAVLSASRPTIESNDPIDSIAEPRPSSSITSRRTASTSNLITLPEIKIVASLSARPKRVIEYVERCREVPLEQGATAGQTVIYCERRPKDELP